MQNYLNIAFFGENSYGVQIAAKTYFNKDVSQLTPEESALLVGLLRAPSAFDPFVNPTAAKARRNEVLQNMVSVGDMSRARAATLKARPIQLATDAPPPVHEGCDNSVTTVKNIGFFCHFVVSWLHQVTGLSDQQLQTGGYKIITTLDPKIQNTAQAQISRQVPAASPYTAVLPVVEPKTGNILAMAASKQYGVSKNQTEQPIFTAQTAAGASTYKLFPLLDALQTGVGPNWELNSYADSPYGHYKTQNCKSPQHTGNGDANESYNQNETLASATAKSSNTFFLAFADRFLDCHLQSVVDLAKSLGISSFDQKESGSETVGQTIVDTQQAQRLVLGSVATSPLELTGAYATVADGGVYHKPAPVTAIFTSDGNALNPKRDSSGTQVVSAQTAAKAVRILTGDTRDVGTSAEQFSSWYADHSSEIAGKTGTQQAVPQSKQNSAIWFAGLTPDVAATSALINFSSPYAPQRGLKGVPNGQAYGDYAAGIWLDALGPSIDSSSWTWPKPGQVDGDRVPGIKGMQLGAAKKKLQQAGYSMQRLGASSSLLCPSSAPLYSVGYFGPTRAPQGTTITVCESSGVPQPVYTPPPPAQPPADTGNGGNGGGHGGGGGNGGGGNGGAATAVAATAVAATAAVATAAVVPQAAGPAAAPQEAAPQEGRAGVVTGAAATPPVAGTSSGSGSPAGPGSSSGSGSSPTGG